MRTRLTGTVLVGVWALLSLVGCGRQPIATVGQTRITRQDLIERLEREGGRDTLLSMIDEQVLRDAYAASGLKVDPQKVQERLAQIKESFPTPEQFAAALARQGLTEQDLVDRVSLQIMMQDLATKDIKVTDEALEQFFKSNSWRMDKPELFTYREIVVSTEEEARKVLAELAKPGADFASLARQHSLSPVTRESGGLVKEQPITRIEPQPVATAIKAMEEGELSEPIQVDKYWYILKLEKKTPPQKADFKRDRKKVEEYYKASQAKQPQELLAELRTKANITILDPRYQDLNELLKPKTTKLPQFGAGPQPASPAGGEAQPAETTGGAPAAGQAPAGGPPAAGRQAAPPSPPATQPAPAKGR